MTIAFTRRLPVDDDENDGYPRISLFPSSSSEARVDMARPTSLASLGLIAALGLAASPSRAEDYPCGSEFRPLTEPAGLSFDIFDMLFPPKFLLQEMFSDRSSSEMPRRKIRFGALDEAGRPVATARIAVLYEGHPSPRRRCGGRRDRIAGPAKYVLVAALATPDGSVRWGSRAVAITEKGRGAVSTSASTGSSTRSLPPRWPVRRAGAAAGGPAPVVEASWFGPHQETGRLVFTPRGDPGRVAITDVPVGPDAPARVEATGRARFPTTSICSCARRG